MNTPHIEAMDTRKRILLFAVMALGMFMALVDTQIVAASIGDIQAGLAAAPDESSWVQSAYLIGEIVMIPFSGWLARVFSTRWVFTVSAACFTVSSVACGFAWDIHSMIVLRAIQGFVGGAMIPTAFAAGFMLFRGPMLAIVPATLGFLGSMAPAIGPTLGGWITDTLSWHWLFFINVAPGLLITFAIPAMGPIDDPDHSLLRRFDFIGLILLALSLGSLEYILEEGYRWNWMDDATIATWVWITIVSGALFIWRCLVHPSPLVDLHLLKDWSFSGPCLFNFITGFGMFGSIYIVPIFLGRVSGLDARQIGDAVFVGGLAQLATVPLVAVLSQKVDRRYLLAAGFSLFALGLWMNHPVTSQWQGDQFFWPQILRGFAILLCIVPATGMALDPMPPQRLKQASALFTTIRNLGGAIGIACINTWLNSRTNLHWHRLAESLRDGDPLVQSWLAKMQAHLHVASSDPQASATRSVAMLASYVRREAVTMAFADVFGMVALCFLVGMLFLFLLKPQPPGGSGSTEAH